MGRTVRGNPQGGALGRDLPAVPGRCLPPRSPRGDPLRARHKCGWGDRTARHFAKAGPAGQLQTASKCRALLTREVSAVAPEERRSHGPKLRAQAYCKPRAGRVIPPSPSRLHRSVRGNERMVRSMEAVTEPHPTERGFLNRYPVRAAPLRCTGNRPEGEATGGPG